MAERWTDDRIDDLKQEVEKQGDRTDSGLREVRSDMRELRKEMRDLRKDVDVRFDQLGARLETRFDTMLYALIGLGGAMFAAMASVVAALIVTQL